MPKAKKTTEAEVSQPSAEPKRRRTKAAPAPAAESASQPEIAAPMRASVATSATASHKHATKKTAQPVEQFAEPTPRRVSHDDIAKLAYSYWEARGFQGGSPEEDWLRAERELLIAAQNR
jgi:hypothetical protein